MRTSCLFLQASVLFLSTSAKPRSRNSCPLLGPAFPFPQELPSSGAFNQAKASLDAAIDAAVKTGSLPFGDGPYNQTAFSVTLFNGDTAGLLYEYHHTPSFISESKVGARKIDADSVYRIASVSKALTAYLLLICDGEAHLNTAVADIIPELARASFNSTLGILIDWSQVTVADLMSQLSPLGYNYGQDGVPPGYFKSKAFPHVPSSQVIPCNYATPNNTYIGCTREQLIQGILTTPALFQPGHTPIYSNVGFDVFGLALEAIAGASLEDILKKNLVEPLALNGTSCNVPKITNNSVIVPYGPGQRSEWYQEFHTGDADGGYFTSSKDMAAIGRAILTNRQISAPITNRWLKPKTFDSSPGSGSAVGAPWEIYRAGSSDYVYYLYTKGGDLDTYHALWALIPDFNFGFTVLATGADGDVSLPGGDLIIDQIMPAMYDIARDQAQKNLGGTYRATQMNSSVTVTTDSHPGIKITEWISNGTDLLKILANDAYGTSLQDFDFRLFPNMLYSGNKVGFTGSLWSLPMDYMPGVFSDPCYSWTGPGGWLYGKVDIGNFVFDIDAATGEAKRVRSEALRIDMERA